MLGGRMDTGNPQVKRTENTSGTGKKTCTTFTFSLERFAKNNTIRMAFSGATTMPFSCAGQWKTHWSIKKRRFLFLV